MYQQQHISLTLAWVWKLILPCLLSTSIHQTLMTNVGAVNPGLKIRLSQPGLNYAASVAVQVLSSDIRGLSIPDVNGDADVTVGKVEYHFNGMSITGFVQPGTSVVVNPGSGLTWTMSNAGASVHGNWQYKYRLGFIDIRDSGSFDVDARGMTASVSVTLGVDSTGHPTISSTGCSCHINDVDIHLHGGASWLYNLFIDKVDGFLRGQIERQVCAAAQKAINENAAHQLAKLNLQITIDNDWLLDYSLVAPPVFGNGYLESSHKGEFFYNGDRSEAPFQAEAFSDIITDKMIAVSVSDYVINTAGYVLYKQGILKYNLSKKDLPPDEQRFLDMTCTGLSLCFGGILPKAKELYPDASVVIAMTVTESPSASIGTDTIVGNFSGTMVYGAQLPNGTVAYMLTTQMTVSLVLTATLDGTVIHAKTDSLTPAITVTDSAIGPVPDSKLNLIFHLSSKFVIRMLNKAGAKGIPIPNINDVKFINTKMQQQPHDLCLATDLEYAPGSHGSNTLFFRPGPKVALVYSED